MKLLKKQLFKRMLKHRRQQRHQQLEKKEEPIIIFPDNTCVLCGQVIPEGRMLCPECESK